MKQGRIPAGSFGGKLPPWLRKRIHPGTARSTEQVVSDLHLNTVCTGAACPNRNECYSCGTATFMILGAVCTRSCAFCNIGNPREPEPVSADEPRRVADAAARLKLDYCVVTSVTRDDLPDRGAGLFADTIRAVRETAGARVEVLTPDFRGDASCIDTVIRAGPDVYNHNLETVPRLYPDVRPQASVTVSLSLLARVSSAGCIAKSGIMTGLGETDDELFALFDDLLESGCRILTIGQYLRPGSGNIPVAEFITPDHFSFLGDRARSMGFAGVASGPFVRSSYRAGELYEKAAS
jgi:lipoic acid synthetase